MKVEIRVSYCCFCILFCNYAGFDLIFVSEGIKIEAFAKIYCESEQKCFGK